MIRPKAIPEIRFPYPYCCKSANMSCNVTAACSSEHAQCLWWWILWWHMLILTVLWLSSRKEGKCDKTSQSRLLWKMNFQSGVHMHVYFNTAPGYGSICRVNWPLCRVNTWATGISQFLERKWWCDVKKENKYCENFRTKPFSQR